MKNYNIAAKKRGDDIIFLRKIVRGQARTRSYGIEVAAGGCRSRVIRRARAILEELETARASLFRIPAQGGAGGRGAGVPCWIWALWSAPSASAPWILGTPSTPIEAMNLLYEL